MEFPERFLCTYLKQSCAIHRTMLSITWHWIVGWPDLTEASSSNRPNRFLESFYSYEQYTCSTGFLAQDFSRKRISILQSRMLPVTYIYIDTVKLFPSHRMNCCPFQAHLWFSSNEVIKMLFTKQHSSDFFKKQTLIIKKKSYTKLGNKTLISWFLGEQSISCPSL